MAAKREDCKGSDEDSSILIRRGNLQVFASLHTRPSPSVRSSTSAAIDMLTVATPSVGDCRRLRRPMRPSEFFLLLFPSSSSSCCCCGRRCCCALLWDGFRLL